MQAWATPIDCRAGPERTVAPAANVGGAAPAGTAAKRAIIKKAHRTSRPGRPLATRAHATSDRPADLGRIMDVTKDVPAGSGPGGQEEKSAQPAPEEPTSDVDDARQAAGPHRGGEHVPRSQGSGQRQPHDGADDRHV